MGRMRNCRNSDGGNHHVRVCHQWIVYEYEYELLRDCAWKGPAAERSSKRFAAPRRSLLVENCLRQAHPWLWLTSIRRRHDLFKYGAGAHCRRPLGPPIYDKLINARLSCTKWSHVRRLAVIAALDKSCSTKNIHNNAEKYKFSRNNELRFQVQTTNKYYLIIICEHVANLLTVKITKMQVKCTLLYL